MEMVGHHDERIAVGFRVALEHALPTGLDPPPQRVQLALPARDDAKHRLVVRHLRGDEEPAIRVIDGGVAELGGGHGKGSGECGLQIADS